MVFRNISETKFPAAGNEKLLQNIYAPLTKFYCRHNILRVKSIVLASSNIMILHRVELLAQYYEG